MSDEYQKLIDGYAQLAEPRPCSGRLEVEGMIATLGVERWLVQSGFEIAVGEWADRNFGRVASWHPLLGVGEELGELNHAHLKRAQGIRGVDDAQYRKDAIDAVGDIVIFLAHYCYLNEIDMVAAINETWAKVGQRDWKADPEKGGKKES